MDHCHGACLRWSERKRRAHAACRRTSADANSLPARLLARYDRNAAFVSRDAEFDVCRPPPRNAVHRCVCVTILSQRTIAGRTRQRTHLMERNAARRQTGASGTDFAQRLDRAIHRARHPDEYWTACRSAVNACGRDSIAALAAETCNMSEVSLTSGQARHTRAPAADANRGNGRGIGASPDAKSTLINRVRREPQRPSPGRATPPTSLIAQRIRR